jgi:hypothetical protein
MSDELIPINVTIADRTYRLKIEPADEELVRKTIKILNDKIVEYKTNFAGKDMQDYISMVLLWFATEQNRTGKELVGLFNTQEKLAVFERQLDKILQEIA